MTPPTPSNPCFDHSYELPLRRNLLLLLDLLGLLRFIAGVLLDRLGVAPCQGGGELLQLPGLTWVGGEQADDAAMERFLAATLWAPAGSPAATTPTRSRTAAVLYKRRPADAEDDGGEGAGGCAICLAALEAGGCHQQQAVVELGVCSHAFHAACIDAWACSGGDAATTWPLCRAPMSPTAWDDDGQSSCHARPGR